MKSKFPEVSEIAEIRCKLTAATHPPTHSLIRHNAVLFLVTIKGPLSASRSCLFSVTSLHFAFEGWSVFSVFVVMQVGSLLQQLDPSHLTAPHRSLPRAVHCWSKEQLTNQLQVRFEKQRYRGKGKGWTPMTWSQSKTITSWIPEALFMFGEIFSTAWNQREAKGWEMPASLWKELLISYVSYLRFCWLRGRNQRSQNALPCVLVPKIMLYVRMPDPFHAPFLLMLSHCKARKHFAI